MSITASELIEQGQVEVGQEKTAFRFTTDSNGAIIGISELPANLRNSLTQ